MALYSLRLRRTLSSLSTLHRSLSAFPSIPAICTPALQSPLLHGPTSASWVSSQPFTLLVQSRLFRSTSLALLSSRSTFNSNSTEEIGPDTILFEGCDYNHWLFVMDFPKDPKPTPEQMIQTYEETCAKGLNISMEEAKQKIYACSTTTYTGFQAVMTEEESNKFQGLPGVIFVLPDSYIDPVNKEYGGDKYINGTIIPRPPPVQYGRQGRPRDRRYGREGTTTNQQWRPSNDYQVSGDGRNYGAPQNHQPQQNYSPQNHQPQQNYSPQNHQPQQNYSPQNHQPQQNYSPQSHQPQQNYSPPGQGERRDPMPMNNRNYGPPGQGERRDPMPMNNRNYGPGGVDSYQSGRGDPVPSYQGSYNPGVQPNYSPQDRRDFPEQDQSHYTPPGQGNFTGVNRNYGPSQDGTYGRGPGGYQGQETNGSSGQGASSGFGQSYSGHGEGQRFSQEEQRNWQGEQRNYPPRGQPGSDQGRY